MPTVRLPDGRRLGWEEYGDATGAPVLLLHGTPGSRFQLARLHEGAHVRGLRLVAPDRPGYGQSDPHPGGSFGDVAHDVVRLLDHLTLPAVQVVAVSGGGGFGLATALAAPDRVDRLVLVSAMAPGVPRADLTGRSRAIGIAFLLARRAPRLLAWLMDRQRQAPPDREPPGARSLPAADRRVLGDQVLRADMARDGLEARRQGSAAAVDELRLYAGPAIPLGAVRVPCVVLHGADDRNVPVPAARWVAAALPDCRLRVVPDAGHLFLAERPDLLLDELTG